MRDVNLDRDWRKVASLQYRQRVEVVRFKDVAGFEDGSVSLEPFLTAFLGANGTGKSTLLSTVRIAADISFQSVPEVILPRFRGATLEVDIQCGESMLTIATTVRDDGSLDRTDAWSGHQVDRDPIAVEYLDIAAEARHQKGVFEVAERRASLMEGVEARLANGRELEMAQYISQKDYVALRTFEVAAPGDYVGDEVLPYFHVEEKGTNALAYGSESMGIGELCLLLYQWHLSRAPAGSLILIDEPESSLPPRSQIALIRTLAGIALAKKCSFVLSTHSDHIIAPAPPTKTRMLYRVDTKTRIVGSPSRERMILALGLEGFPEAYLLCEDRLADKLLFELLHQAAEELWPRAERVRIGGAAKIRSIVDSSPITGNFHVIGVYDGDLHGTEVAADHSHKVYLPGRVSPDALIRNVVTTRTAEFASAAALELSRLEFVLANIAGLDSHDWVEGLSEKVSISEDMVVRTVVSLLPQDEIQDFATSIRRLVALSRTIIQLETMAELREADRPGGLVIGELLEDVRSCLADGAVLIGESWRTRGQAAIDRFARVVPPAVAGAPPSPPMPAPP